MVIHPECRPALAVAASKIEGSGGAADFSATVTALAIRVRGLSIAAIQVHPVQQFVPCKPALQIFHQQIRLALPQMLARGAHVWRDEYVVELPERIFRRQRFLRCHVQRGACDSLLGSAEINAGSSTSAPRDNIQEIRRGFHERELARADHVAGFGRFRRGQDDKISLRQAPRRASKLGKLARRDLLRLRPERVTAQTRIPSGRIIFATSRPIAPKPMKSRICPRSSRGRTGRVPQFLLRPMRLLLIAEAVGKTASECDESAENVLGHRDAVNAARVGNLDAALPKFRIHQLADAGGRRVKPFEFLARVRIVRAAGRSRRKCRCRGVHPVCGRSAGDGRRAFRATARGSVPAFPAADSRARTRATRR